MFYDQIMESAAYIRGRIAQEPSIGVVLGSGLGALVDWIQKKLTPRGLQEVKE